MTTPSSAPAGRPREDEAGDTQGTIALVRRLTGVFLRPYLGQIALALAAMVVVAGTTAANAWLMQPMLDKIFIARDGSLLWLVAVSVIILAVIKGFATYAQAVMMTMVGQHVIADVQTSLFARLMRADLAFFHANSTGSLISRFTNDANLLRGAAANILAGIGKDALTVVFLVALMFYQDWVLALASFVVFPLDAPRLRQYADRARPVHHPARPDLPGGAPRQGLWHGGLRG